MSLSLGNSNKSSLDAYASWSSIVVLKDHKSMEATALSRDSYKSVVREEASQQGFDMNNVEVREGEDHSCKLLTALEQIKFTQLDLKAINLSGIGKVLMFFF